MRYFHRHTIHILLLNVFLIFSLSVEASSEKISLDFRQIHLPDAILLLAKFLNKNVLLSPAIVGTATLALQDADPEAAFDLLLVTHGLEKWSRDNIFIAPREELIAIKQAEIKWQEILLKSAPLLTKVWPLRYAKAEVMASVLLASPLTLISSRGLLRADSRTNSLCIEEIAANMPKIVSIIKQLDVPVKQIVIEARLLSIDEGVEQELGFQFHAHGGSAAAENSGTKANIFPLLIAKLADQSWLEVRLSALEKAGRAELISSPRLFTANQQPASIEAGEEVPYQESSESGGTAIAFKKAVLSLQVTPQILPGNQMIIQLKINQDRPSQRMVLGMPTISTHQISTSVMLKNGETVVLGGIYEHHLEKGEWRVPVLSQIPLLGVLFRQQNTRENKRQLLIFVRPRIVESRS